jgi:hypothetical protein
MYPVTVLLYTIRHFFTILFFNERKNSTNQRSCRTPSQAELATLTVLPMRLKPLQKSKNWWNLRKKGFT